MRHSAAPISLQLEEAEGSRARLSVYLSLAYAATIWQQHFILEHKMLQTAFVAVNGSGGSAKAIWLEKLRFMFTVARAEVCQEVFQQLKNVAISYASNFVYAEPSNSSFFSVCPSSGLRTSDQPCSSASPPRHILTHRLKIGPRKRKEGS